MNDISPVVDQVRLFMEQQLPTDPLTRAIPLALMLLVAGVALSVLGAKLAKPGIAVAFAGLGAMVGVAFGRDSALPTPLCALVAAAMMGAVGHLTFRLWVGLGTAAVFTLLTWGAFGYRNVLPYAAEFQGRSSSPAQVQSEMGVMPLPVPGVEQLDRTPRQWAEDFWSFVAAKDAGVERDARMLGTAAMLTGLFLGVIAVRWMAILSTSLVGTALVVSGVGTLLTQLVPGVYQAVTAGPTILGIGVGGFLVTSLIIQTLITRKAPAAEPASSGKH
ncbi:MAG: hypothetical protein HY763_00170 [Planctomycetes bacterium]|nr:hypothetical protein [Planctomycetota bacterium]